MNDPWKRKSPWAPLRQFLLLAALLPLGALMWGILQMLIWVTGTQPPIPGWMIFTSLGLAAVIVFAGIAIWTDHKDAWLKKRRDKRTEDKEYERRYRG